MYFIILFLSYYHDGILIFFTFKMRTLQEETVCLEKTKFY